MALAGVLVLVVVGLAALFITTSTGSTSASDLQVQVDRRTAATSAARQFAVNFMSYDYRTLDRDLTRVTDQLTPVFQKDFLNQEKNLRPLLAKEKVVAKGTVLGAGLSIIAKDQAVVLVAINQDVQNIVQKNGQKRWRLKCTMTDTPSGWQAADVTPVE